MKECGEGERDDGREVVGGHTEPVLSKMPQASPMPGGISPGPTPAPLPVTQGPFSCVTSELWA